MSVMITVWILIALEKKTFPQPQGIEKSGTVTRAC